MKKSRVDDPHTGYLLVILALQALGRLLFCANPGRSGGGIVLVRLSAFLALTCGASVIPFAGVLVVFGHIFFLRVHDTLLTSGFLFGHLVFKFFHAVLLSPLFAPAAK
ncbi:hypothetical protein B5G06_06690 [Flavonifractor sp. An52]|nr:hypothetical protein B5G06_06690 [Flavonifractor sp. An52]